MLRRITYAFVTSPMPWDTSMLVSQPRISTETAGPLGIVGCVVDILTGVSEGIKVGAVVAVINEILVNVGRICTVAVGPAATTGVAVKTEGVFVGGRKEVGGLNCSGWITQPLQDAVNSIRRITGMVFFISSPHEHCIPLCLFDN